MSHNKKDVLLLVSRLIIGIVFVSAGWMKANSMQETIGFFAQMGLPAFLAYLVAYAEIIAGIAVVLGMWMEKATIVLGIIMIGATYFSWGGGFQMYGLPLALLAGILSLHASGAGSYIARMKK